MIERAFLYGDLLFESIRVRNGEIRYADKHYSRLSRSAELLKFDLSVFCREIFTDAIHNALEGKSEARVRFILYRDSRGYYTPESNQVNWKVEVYPFEGGDRVCENLGV